MNSMIVAMVTAGVLAATSVLVFGADNTAPKTALEKNGYSVGFDIGSTLKKQPLDLEADAVVRGLRDGLKGSAPAMTQDEMAQQMNALRQEAQRRVTEKRTQETDKNLKEGEAFLAKNKKEKGVKTTDSGLQYKIVKVGTGPKPTVNDTVSVHYRGTLINGTEFDNSHKRGEPASFPVKGVIAGWIEALPMMPQGSSWMLYIPAKLAYAERGQGAQIGPNATLIFEVELLSIAKSGS